MLPNETLIPLVLFTALLLVFSLHALAASGHFPREYRAPTLASAPGAIILYGTIAAAMTSLAVAVLAAWQLVPWYAAIIGGGLAILAAPIVLQKFPDRFVDGRASLLSFAAVGALLALLLVWLSMDGRSKGNSSREEKMIAVIFEVSPKPERKKDYLDIAAGLRPLLEKIDGFISTDRFESLYEPGRILSLSFFRDEAAVQAWRSTNEHRIAQAKGRREIFSDYRIRVASVIRDYGMNEREHVPSDSRKIHGV